MLKFIKTIEPDNGTGVVKELLAAIACCVLAFFFGMVFLLAVTP
jgi:hypothetical protein